MQVLNKNIDMIVWFKANGELIPIKFRINDENENTFTIKIDKILSCERQKRAGQDIYLYDCQTLAGECVKRYILKYMVGSCNWYLFKV